MNAPLGSWGASRYLTDATARRRAEMTNVYWPSGCVLAAHQLSPRYALRSTQMQRAACARKHTPVCFLWTPLGR